MPNENSVDMSEILPGQPVDPEFGIPDEGIDDGFLIPGDMEAEPIRVYGVANAEKHLIDVKSTIFYPDAGGENEFLIDQGFGDNYAHVGEYIRNVLGSQLYDENMCANFKLETFQRLEEIEEETQPVRYIVSERTQEEKDLELTARPEPPRIPTIGEVAEIVASVQEDTTALFEGLVEVDNKSLSMEEDTTALFEGLVEVDNKAIKTQEDIKVQEGDIGIVMDALCEVDAKLRMILEHLKLPIE